MQEEADTAALAIRDTGGSRVSQRLVPLLCIGQLVLWYGLRPRGEEIPFFGWVGFSGLKLLGLVGLVGQFAAIHAGIGAGRIRAMRVVVAWTTALVVTLVLLGHWRESIGATFETYQTHLVRPSEEIGYPVLDQIVSEEQVRHRQFVKQWERGEILAIEASLALILGLVHGIVARRAGRQAGHVSVLVASGITLWIWIVIGLVFQLTLVTYDTFYLGSMAGPLVTDVLAPWTMYPTTPLAVPFYAALSIACWWVLRERAASRATHRGE